jgi:hypothetical protein
VLVRRTRAPTAWRCLGSQRILGISSLPCEQALDRGQANHKRAGNLRACHTPGGSGDDSLPEIKRVGFHERSYAKYSLFLLTAVS